VGAHLKKRPHVGFFSFLGQGQRIRSSEDVDAQHRFDQGSTPLSLMLDRRVIFGGLFGESAMNQATTILEIEYEGEILILKPVIKLHDLDELALEGAVNELSERMDHSGVTDVFLDLHGTDILYSQAPRLAVELWKRAWCHGGSMAIRLN
jgi:hypothetical protein